MVNHVVNSGCILTYVLVSWMLSVTQGVGKVSSAFGVFYATWAEPGSWLSLSVILAVTTFPCMAKCSGPGGSRFLLTHTQTHTHTTA